MKEERKEKKEGERNEYTQAYSIQQKEKKKKSN